MFFRLLINHKYGLSGSLALAFNPYLLVAKQIRDKFFEGYELLLLMSPPESDVMFIVNVLKSKNV